MGHLLPPHDWTWVAKVRPLLEVEQARFHRHASASRRGLQIIVTQATVTQDAVAEEPQASGPLRYA